MVFLEFAIEFDLVDVIGYVLVTFNLDMPIPNMRQFGYRREQKAYKKKPGKEQSDHTNATSLQNKRIARPREVKKNLIQGRRKPSPMRCNIFFSKFQKNRNWPKIQPKVTKRTW